MSPHNSPSRRHVLAFLGSAAALSCVPGSAVAQETTAGVEGAEVPYTVAEQPWPEERGNHRVHVFVDQPASVVHVSIPWRRLDPDPEQKAVLLFGPQDIQVLNLAVVEMSAASAEVFFEATMPDDYFLYYLPHKKLTGHQSVLGPKGQYMAPQQAQTAAWNQLLQRARTTAGQIPRARLIQFQARTAFDSFYPMEVPATRDEIEQLGREYPNPVLLFAEDRDHPIRMYKHLPLRWIQRGPSKTFSAQAWRGEFYAFQIGLYAPEHSGIASAPISLRFDDLTGPGGERIPASAWRCINTDGVDARGNAFHNEVMITAGNVVPLWFGLQVPLHCRKGIYRGNVAVLHRGDPVSLQFELEVKEEFVPASGTDQLGSLARISWLDSTIGSDDTITAPYVPLQIEQRTISCLGRTVTFADNGFPLSVKVNHQEMLAGPIELNVYRGSTKVRWESTCRIISSGAAAVRLESISQGDGYELHVRTTMEFDGGIGCDVSLTSGRTGSVSDITLEIPYIKERVPYAVGMSLKGGIRPRSWRWNWSEQPPRWKEQGSNLEYFLWMGDVHAGLYCRLKSPLPDWMNRGEGGVTIDETAECVLLRATSGQRSVNANEEMHFSFRLLPTPVKPLDPSHWKDRYAHAYQPPTDLQELGATVINIHQGTLPNMYINYPFMNLDLLGPYVSEAHRLGMKVKIYYTMRELTTRLPELWALRSLAGEIYRTGGTQGQGNPQLDFWLQEHLHGDYSPGWTTVTPTGTPDTSLRVHSDSRLANFYLEGLKWLLDNVPIDGLYLDEIGYDRSIMQRVRKVLQRRPTAMIDMHGNHDWWSCNCPIGYYMEHLPYIDRLWLGEAFDPASPPDFWLIEMSGLPFGLSSDLLERPNPWRGMLFGMTDRALYSGPAPAPIWKLWDAFGIEDSAMLGWWEADVPVKIRTQDIFATVYVKNGRCLIAIASWARETTRFRLDIDWGKLGLNPNGVTLTAPALQGLQSFQKLSPDQELTVPTEKGYLLLLEQA